VIGQCAGSRLPVPVYETAFALARFLEDRGARQRTRITIVSPTPVGLEFGPELGATLTKTFLARGIELVSDFSPKVITRDSLFNSEGQSIDFNLLMLLPPFQGSPAASYVGITNAEGYINVENTMRVHGHERIYAVGDCVNFNGPKMGHMAVRQGEVAALNVIADLKGRRPEAHYVHELKSVIDASGNDSIYVHRDIWTNDPGSVRQGYFWRWAKRAQQEYWELAHS
jgi:sulfide:quinone oxidoreductase